MPKNDNETVRVRLLAGRHPYGRAGVVCDYPAHEAEAHAEQGLVEILGPEAEEEGDDAGDAGDDADAPTSKAKPKRKPAKKAS